MFCDFFDFLSLKNDVNVASKSNKQKTLRKKLFIVAILKVTDENSRIQSRIWSRLDRTMIFSCNCIATCVRVVELP
jgi:hypothetical protein